MDCLWSAKAKGFGFYKSQVRDGVLHCFFFFSFQSLPHLVSICLIIYNDLQRDWPILFTQFLTSVSLFNFSIVNIADEYHLIKKLGVFFHLRHFLCIFSRRMKLLWSFYSVFEILSNRWVCNLCPKVNGNLLRFNLAFNVWSFVERVWDFNTTYTFSVRLFVARNSGNNEIKSTMSWETWDDEFLNEIKELFVLFVLKSTTIKRGNRAAGVDREKTLKAIITLNNYGTLPSIELWTGLLI